MIPSPKGAGELIVSPFRSLKRGIKPHHEIGTEACPQMLSLSFEYGRSLLGICLSPPAMEQKKMPGI